MNKKIHQNLSRYFEDLSYRQISEIDGISLYVHNKSGKELLVQYGLKNNNLPDLDIADNKKFLLILTEPDVNKLGFSLIESYSENLPSNAGIVFFEDDYLEHTMKDIWFFLNS